MVGLVRHRKTRALTINVKYYFTSVESRCGGGLDGTYRLPALSFAGASLVPPCFRFHTPLSEPDVRICRIRLSEKTHAIALAIACDAVCNFWNQSGVVRLVANLPSCVASCVRLQRRPLPSAGITRKL